jgi:type I restriction enzyme R subunit
LALDTKVIHKLRTNQIINENDLSELEEKLNSPELFITEDVLRKVYNQTDGTLVEFIKQVLGLYKLPTREEKISEAFRTFLVEGNYLNANQINFLRTLESVFIKRKHIEYSDLYDSPFTNFGSEAPIPLFSEYDLNQMIKLCSTLENEVFKK